MEADLHVFLTSVVDKGKAKLRVAAAFYPQRKSFVEIFEKEGDWALEKVTTFREKGYFVIAGENRSQISEMSSSWPSHCAD